MSIIIFFTIILIIAGNKLQITLKNVNELDHFICLFKIVNDDQEAADKNRILNNKMLENWEQITPKLYTVIQFS